MADFAQDAEIFIDANIFTYFALKNPTYQAACTAFLSKVEAGKVRAVATCQHYGIVHVATTDSHFERVNLLNVWKPEAA